ncbi:MAG: hypothetical protein GSR81_00220 [Desulfurococcales archaeon]|nr:hypothetical protein [Desulfurococcales archaeon]
MADLYDIAKDIHTVLNSPICLIFLIMITLVIFKYFSTQKGKIKAIKILCKGICHQPDLLLSFWLVIIGMTIYVFIYALTLSSTEDLNKFLSAGLLIITVGLGVISIYNTCPYYCSRRQNTEQHIIYLDNNRNNTSWEMDYSIMKSFIFVIFILVILALLIPELRDSQKFSQLIVALATLLMAFSVAVQAIDIRRQVYISRKQSEEISKQTRLMYETLRLDSAVKIGDALAYLWRKFITLYNEGINNYDRGITCDSLNLSSGQPNVKINPDRIIDSLNYLKDIILILEQYNIATKEEIEKLKEIKEKIWKNTIELVTLKHNLETYLFSINGKKHANILRISKNISILSVCIFLTLSPY